MWMNNAKQAISDVEIIVARIYIAPRYTIGRGDAVATQQATFLIVIDRHFIWMRNTYMCRYTSIKY